MSNVPLRLMMEAAVNMSFQMRRENRVDVSAAQLDHAR
jgi:hypothetical protein